MPYGTIKVDQVIYTKGGSDTTITVSGIVDSLSGAISVTGAISGASVLAATGTFTTLSGNTTAGTTATFVTGVFTTSLSGATITGNTGQFSNITGVSGVFTTRISGATITGNTGQFSSITGISGVFTSVSGTTFTVTSGVFASGTAAAPSVSVGTTTNGLYSSATNEVALATNSTSRLVVDASGNVNIDSGTFYVDAVNNRVGIGTTGPSQALTVNGSIDTQNAGYVRSVGAGSDSPAVGPNIGVNSPNTIYYIQQLNASNGLDFWYYNVGWNKRLTLDASGNLGLGVVPSAWGAGFKAIEGAYGQSLSYDQNNPNTSLVANAFNDGSWKYKISSFGAGRYTCSSGAHYWYTAPSGTAGTAITFTQAMTLDASGNLGVGVTSPTARLHLAISSSSGTSNADGIRINSGGNVAINIGSNSSIGYGWIQSANWGSGYIPTVINPNGGNVGIGTTIPNGTLDINNGSAVFSNSGTYIGGIGRASGLIGGTTSEIAITTSGAQGLLFGINNAERARIDSSGRLLVGTSTSRTSAFGQGLHQIEGGSGNAFSSVTNAENSQFGGAFILAKTRGSAFQAVTNNDNLGILSFQGANGSALLEAARIDAATDGAVTGGGANDMPGRLVFSTTADGASSPTERMRITNTGNIHLNNFTDTDVSNNITSAFIAATGRWIFSGKNTDTVLDVNQTFDDTNARNAIRFYRNETQVGSVSVSTTATAFNTSSDYRLKENVTAVTDGITRLQQLKPSRFNFIADPGKTVDGFLAHEVQGVVPEAVTGEKDAIDNDGNPIYQGIDQSKLVPLLTAALQEAVAEINGLKDRVAALEGA